MSHGRPKRRRPQRSRRHIGANAGIAVASACKECGWVIHDAKEIEGRPGYVMALIHDHHVPELVALGWVLTEYPADPPDVVCEHYHAAFWQDS
jgi:hypothetical protein